MSSFSIAYLIELKDKYTKVARKVAETNQKMRETFSSLSGKLSSFSKSLDGTKEKFSRLSEIGKSGMAKITLPIIASGGAMIKFASDMEETMNKVQVSLGKSSDKAIEWSKNSIKSMGLAQQTALDSVALYGDMATGMGFTQEKAGEMAMSLTQLGADLASFKNISNDMAQTALKSIFTGETESLKNLGIVMTQANLEQYLMSKGMKVNIKDLNQTQQVMLRYKYVMEMTKNAQGDFIRTGGGAANQTRMFGESVKQLGVYFGTLILPYFTKVVQKANSLLVKIMSLDDRTKKLVLAFAGIASIIPVVIYAIGALGTGFINFITFSSKVSMYISNFIGLLQKLNIMTKIMNATQVIFNATLWSNPITWIVGAIIALIAVIVLAYQKVEWFRNLIDIFGLALQVTWTYIKILALIIARNLQPILVSVGQFLSLVWSKVVLFGQSIAQLWGKITGILSPLINFGKFLFLWTSPLGIVINLISTLIKNFDLITQGIEKAKQAMQGFKANADAKLQTEQKMLNGGDVSSKGRLDGKIVVAPDKGAKVVSIKSKTKGSKNVNVGINRAGKGKV